MLDMDLEKEPMTDDQMADSFIGIEEIEQIENRSYSIIEQLREQVFAPDKTKELRLRFSQTEAAEMVGRTQQTIRDAEKKVDHFPKPERSSNKRKIGYTLAQINQMRRHFGTLPHRADTDEPIILAVANFKGGVGKSTDTCHLAQYFALKGYRVCVIDCDPQGSTTALFGMNPDLDVEEEDTMFPYLMHETGPSLEYAVIETYFPGIFLVPANLSLYNAEYELAASAAGHAEAFDRLRMGVDSIKHHFDVVLIDPPPALGMISLSVLRAANALVVPVPPSTVDFASTAHFFTMLREALQILEKHGLSAGYKFLKVVAGKVNENKSAHLEIIRMMQELYGNTMLDGLLKDSAEIDNATMRLMTVYELEGPITSRDTHNRCKAYLNAVNKEIEIEVRKTWPSHREALRKEGVI